MMRGIGAVVAACAAGLLVGCGGSDDEGKKSAGTASGGQVSTQAASAIDRLYEGTYQAPPESAPRPMAGRRVWLISPGQNVSTFSAAIGGAAEAARAIGWTTKVYDTKGDQAAIGNGIRQAVAGKAEAIVLYAIDCASAKAPLGEARAAGIRVVAAEGLDCDETNPGEQPLFDGAVTYVEGSFREWIAAYGETQADWLIADRDGAATTIAFTNNEQQAAVVLGRAFDRRMAECADCKVERVAFSFGDMGSKLQNAAGQALLRNPNANAVQVPADGLITGGVGPAVQSSGRELAVMGGEGQSANVDLVRAGKQQTAGIGIPVEWEGYAAIDTLNRLFHGEQGVSSGIGLQVFDRDHNLPESGAYAPPVDFRAAYRAAWGVDG